MRYDASLYYIMTSLRAPDSSGRAAIELEELFSARIRYWLFGKDCPSGVKIRSRPTEWDDIEKTFKALKRELDLMGCSPEHERFCEELRRYLDHVSIGLKTMIKEGSVPDDVRKEARLLKEVADILLIWAFNGFYRPMTWCIYDFLEDVWRKYKNSRKKHCKNRV